MKKNIETKNVNKVKVFFDSASNLFFLFIKSYFKSSAFFIINIFIPFVLVFSIVIAFPIAYGFSWIIFITLSFSSFASYGILYFNFRNSNAYKNLELTNVTVASIYFSILTVIFLIVFITFLFDLFFLQICISAHMVANLWGFQPANSLSFSYDISKMAWSTLFYYLINIILLTFSMSFVIQEIAQSQKGFFLIVFIFVISGLFFGGTFSPTIYIDGKDGNKFKVMDVDTFDNVPVDEQIGVYVRSYIWGGRGWEISQIFPTYGINQIMFGSFNSSITTFKDGVAQDNLWSSNGNNLVDMLSNSGDEKILYYTVMPWLWTFFDFWLGGFLSTRKNLG